MEFIDPSSNPDAYEYAFMSAMVEHITILKEQTSLVTLINQNDDQMDDGRKAIHRSEIIYNLETVVEFFLKKILTDHVKADLEQSKNWGLPSESLIFNFESIMLGPNAQSESLNVSPSLTTAELYFQANNPRKRINYTVPREKELSKSFYSVLRNAFEFHCKNNYEAGKTNYSVMLSAYVAAYLRLLMESDSPVVKSMAYLFDKVNSVINELEKYSQVNTKDVPIKSLYSCFQDFLKFHLEMLVSSGQLFQNSKEVVTKLREQGNNLMANTAYPQAIKVYTEAILHCVGETKNQISQLLVNRSIAYIGLTCFPEAIVDLNLAVSLDISFTPAWVQLAYAHLYMGNSLFSLNCYDVALKCCTGDVLPQNFPVNESYMEEYKTNKRQSTLPQFVEQILKSVELTEIRAKQQRKLPLQISNIIASIKSLADTLAKYDPSDDKSRYSYPPKSTTPSAFREMAERVNSTRPSILSHEVSQGVLAAADSFTSNTSRPSRSPIVSLEIIGPIRSTRPETPLNPLRLSPTERQEDTGSNATPNATNEQRRPNTDTFVRDMVREYLPGMDGLTSFITHSFGGSGEINIIRPEGQNTPNSQTNNQSAPTNQSNNNDQQSPNLPDPELD